MIIKAQRTISVLLAVIMLTAIIPFAQITAGADVVNSGKCGENRLIVEGLSLTAILVI